MVCVLSVCVCGWGRGGECRIMLLYKYCDMLMDEPIVDPKSIGDIMTYTQKKITPDFGYK